MIAFAQPEPLELVPQVEIRDLDGLTDEELDRLPYGVIALAGDGTILRYNLAEARFARLDRNQVLGLNFYRQIAPCTATPEFEGRFRSYVESKSTMPTSFPYIFDFKFGAQEVEVELVGGRRPDHFYLCINRRRFLPQRLEQRDELLAPLQSELAPGEADQGVLRDAGSRRSVIASPLFFESLRQTWDKMAPRAWGLFCEEWGTRWGRLAVVDLEAEALEDTGETLRDLPMEQVVVRLSRYLIRHGWGRLQVDFTPSAAGAFVLDLERNALAEAVGWSEVPRCHLLAGFFRAVFSHLALRLISVQEACCKAQGFDACRFVAVGEGRGETLKSALELHPSDVRKVVEHLGGTLRGAT